MKLVQKILSHGLLIAFIVAAFFIYMNRMELFPQWFAKPAPANVSHTQVTPETPATAAAGVPVPEAGAEAQVQLPVEVEAAEMETAPVVPEQEVVVAEQTDAVVVAPATETSAGVSDDTGEPVSAAAVEPEPVRQDAASGDAAPVFRPLKGTETSEAAPSASAEEAGSQQAAVGATPEQTPGSTNEQIVTESEPAENEPAVIQQAAAGQEHTAPSGYQQQLELARAHYWKRDIPAALQVYQSLAETWPERAEVWGEMGNLYFSIRKKPEAINAYARAIRLLTEQGNDAGARALLDVMYRLDARRASQLEMSLRQTGG